MVLFKARIYKHISANFSIGPIELGWWYIPLSVLVINATTNSVNFTDGLDGLASELLIMSFGAFGIIAFAGMFILAALAGNMRNNFCIFMVQCSTCKILHGRLGSLALGATLGVIAMLTDQA